MDFTSYRKKLSSGETSVNELVQNFFLNINKLNPKINAYTSITKEIADSQAKKIDNPPSLGISP